MDYKECKFYENGKCTHEDAPPNALGCIGYDACGAREDDISYKKKEQKGMTGKQMCAIIARALRLYDPIKYKNVKPKRIWEISPSGELYPVFELYDWAKGYLGAVVHNK